MFTNMYTQNYYSFIRWPSPRNYVAYTGNKLTWGHPLSPMTMQVASMPVGLVSTQVPLITHNTRSAKLPFFQAAAVVVIVDFACIKDCDKRREGVNAWDKLNIQVQMPPPNFCLKLVRKKRRGRGGIFGTLYVYPTVYMYPIIMRVNILFFGQ